MVTRNKKRGVKASSVCLSIGPVDNKQPLADTFVTGLSDARNYIFSGEQPN